MHVKTRRVWIAVGTWLAAIALAAALDRAVAEQLREWRTDRFFLRNDLLRETIKAPGTYWFAIVLAIPVALLHRRGWHAAAMLLLATATSVLNFVLKWTTGRARPFRSFAGDTGVATPFDLHPVPFLYMDVNEVRNLCFPSGHAAMAFATATALGILWPRYRPVFYAFAAIVAAERVLENSHWLSDVVSGAALGVGGVTLVSRFVWTEKSGDAKHE
jgi:membrane-associated phospholipid phosphatase